MRRYATDDDMGALAPWGFNDPRSAYVIVAGMPRVSGRIDMGGPGHGMRAGIWRCTTGVFDCTELGDELMTVLSGRCRVHDMNRSHMMTLEPGDSAMLAQGSRVRWEISEDLTKVFLAHRSGDVF